MNQNYICALLPNGKPFVLPFCIVANNTHEKGYAFVSLCSDTTTRNDWISEFSMLNFPQISCFEASVSYVLFAKKIQDIFKGSVITQA